jgi:hypothetical protein
MIWFETVGILDEMTAECVRWNAEVSAMFPTAMVMEMYIVPRWTLLETDERIIFTTE